MICGDLPNTGFPVTALLTFGVACVLVGVLMLLFARSRRCRAATIAVVLLIVAAGVSASNYGNASAEPVTTSCVAIDQISPVLGLAPGIAPTPITGLITNHWPETIFITAVTVSIASVMRAPGSVDGTCDASDFILLDTEMPVGRSLEPSESAEFSGALIGFNGKSVNQDTCQSATVDLQYVST